MATARNGQFLLRIEDIDQSRARPEWEAAIYTDLHWLGLNWPAPVLRQSERGATYAEALNQLWTRGLLYPCTCTRRDIEAAASAPQEGVPLHGPDGVIYPGTCRPKEPITTLPIPKDTALRLDIAHALATLPPEPLRFTENGAGPDGASGDVVLLRRDMGTSYHLSVVLDDAAQGITDVVRGQDLFEATQIHVLLQQLLGFPTPTYHHHRLIRDDTGKRLAKRDDARAIAKYRAEGATPTDIRAMIGL
ncbi:UNVERIFIED_CONTAM: hypothetical protein GTU68_006130 [Idotea baltica]|nr:hypothetical protein [Idotea baltica]